LQLEEKLLFWCCEKCSNVDGMIENILRVSQATDDSSSEGAEKEVQYYQWTAQSCKELVTSSLK